MGVGYPLSWVKVREEVRKLRLMSLDILMPVCIGHATNICYEYVKSACTSSCVSSKLTSLSSHHDTPYMDYA